MTTGEPIVLRDRRARDEELPRMNVHLLAEVDAELVADGEVFVETPGATVRV